MTKHFITLSDRNYLVYGLTLYESIKKNIGSGTSAIVYKCSDLDQNFYALKLYKSAQIDL